MNTLNDSLQKLNQIPSLTNQILREVRDLDKEVLKLHLDINQKREEAIRLCVEYQQKKSSKMKADISRKLRDISQTHGRMVELSNRKIELTDKLYNYIDEPTELMEKQATRLQQAENRDQGNGSKPRRGPKSSGTDFLSSQPSYCYCKNPSYGLMVKCDGQSCEIEWFHTNCIDEKGQSLDEKWYCRDCRKNKTKSKLR